MSGMQPGPDALAAKAQAQAPAHELKRSLGLALLVLYGLGVTVGAGIYVLVGTAAGRAGVHAPVAFVLAGIVMALTAASFGELAARFPVAAGEAAYVEAGFGSRALAILTGLLVIVAGIVSAAAISQGAAGYIGVLAPVPTPWLVGLVVVAMGIVAAGGISQAVGLAALMTVIEIGGLLTIIVTGLRQDPGLVTDLPLMLTGLSDGATWSRILAASLVAFFAFMGFEGMVNVAEEVKRPERTVPLALGLTLVITTVLYILTVWVVIRSVPAAELATARAPISIAYERLTGASPLVISLIAIFATINGVIVQMVMSSRVVYGLAKSGALPAALARVNGTTRTPLAATGLVVALTLLSALALPIDRLADATTRVMLVVFGLVNAALIGLKISERAAHPGFAVPLLVPALGLASCAAMLLADLLR